MIYRRISVAESTALELSTVALMLPYFSKYCVCVSGYLCVNVCVCV